MGSCSVFSKRCCLIFNDAAMKAIASFDGVDGIGYARLNEAFITHFPKNARAADIWEF